jgi:thiamine biosynthesis lipoprotein
MSSAAVEARTDGGIHRRVEHVMGMPISLAMRGRYAATTEADRAWQSVIDQLREVDQAFSTYREDSVINRLDRGELALEQCPAEIAEVLQLGREAEQLSDGAFSIMLPSASGRRRLDPSGVVKGWALQRASQFLAALHDTDYCLSGGGDIVCHTANLSRPEWRIGIEHPHNPKALILWCPSDPAP